MSLAWKRVWLVELKHRPAAPGVGTWPIGAHRLYVSRQSADEGLRDMFEETLGINDLPPEVLTTKSQFEDGETGIYYNKFTLGDTEISFMVTPLEIRE